MKSRLPRLLCLLFLLFSRPASAGSVTLEWDANTESDLAGYKLHYGTASGNYTQSIDAGPALTVTAPNLTGGTTYFFVLTAYNTAGLESLPSNEVRYTVPVQRLVLTLDTAAKKLTWTDSVPPQPPQLTSYFVERAGPDGAWLWSAVVAAKEMSLPTGLPGGTYSFRVSVIGLQGTVSNVVTMNVPEAPKGLRLRWQISTDLQDWHDVAEHTMPEPSRLFTRTIIER